MKIRKRKLVIGILVVAATALFAFLLSQLFNPSPAESTNPSNHDNSSFLLDLQEFLDEMGDDETLFTIIPGESKLWFVQDKSQVNEPPRNDGGVSSIRGYAQFSPKDPTRFNLSPIQINIGELLVNGRVRNRVARQVLKVDQYPYLQLTPRKIIDTGADSTELHFQVEIVGDLTLRGVTKPVTFIVNGSMSSTSELRMDLTGEIVLADFGIELPNIPFIGNTFESAWLRAHLIAIQGAPPTDLSNPIALPTEGPAVTGVTISHPDATDGYTLIAPMFSTNNYLIDLQGTVVHTWETEHAAIAAYLLEDGSLLRSVFIGRDSIAKRFGGSIGSTGRVERLDWNGNISWFFEYSTEQHLLHHDIEPLPGGNVLLVAWEAVSEETAIRWGRQASTVDTELWMDMLLEVDPKGNIVWEWHISDHLVQDRDPLLPYYGEIAQTPERIDINAGRIWTRDWTHVNAVDYNPQLDQILISVNGFNEFWIIDHSTTSAEAAGSSGGNFGAGGDLLYRGGNPQSYSMGDENLQTLFGFHDAHWIQPGFPGEGNILLFNNGNNRSDGNYSSVDEIAIPVDPDGNYASLMNASSWDDQVVWRYTSEDRFDFFAPNISGAQRLANGNTFITSGPSGELFEVSPEGTILWKYVSPFGGAMGSGANAPGENRGPLDLLVTSIFRAIKYPPDYPGVSTILEQN
jgi:polyisoprenoid-binding protein YceI